MADEEKKSSDLNETLGVKTVEIDAKKAEKISFITLDNIGNYFGGEGEEDTVESLIKKAAEEYELALRNKVVEKRSMLLNNVCIYFDKITDKKGRIPSGLFMDTKGSLLHIYTLSDNREKAARLYGEIKDFYDALSENEQEDYEIKYAKILFDYVKYLNGGGRTEEFLNVIKVLLAVVKGNETDDGLLIESNCYSMLGAIYFQAKMYDPAIDFAYNALALTNRIENKTAAINNQYAIFAFNLGNIYFQADKYDNAIKLFTTAIDFAKTQVFESVFIVFKTASNYLAQVYVCQGEYQKAIDRYLSAIEYMSATFSGKTVTETNIDFLQRISLIYKEYLNDERAADKYGVEAQKLMDSLSDSEGNE